MTIVYHKMPRFSIGNIVKFKSKKLYSLTIDKGGQAAAPFGYKKGAPKSALAAYVYSRSGKDLGSGAAVLVFILLVLVIKIEHCLDALHKDLANAVVFLVIVDGDHHFLVALELAL